MTPMVEASLKQIDLVNWEEAARQFVTFNPMKRFSKARRSLTSWHSCCPMRPCSSMPL
jgi:hypothetical protein